MMLSLDTIRNAMSTRLEGQKHIPEKISFHYLKYEIRNINQQVYRRKGDKYTVSPFEMMIYEGEYYLLAVDDKSKKLRTYRIDRMKDVALTGVPREGEAEYRKVNTKNYAQRVFGMYSGEKQYATIRFINPLLDTVVERFGTNAQYRSVDKSHFSVYAEVEISDQFFGWVMGFGNKAKILGNDRVLEEFRKYLGKIREKYPQAFE